MKLESQVCSLNLANKLNELGCKQESLFYWVGSKEIHPKILYSSEHEYEHFLGIAGFNSNFIYSAFTVAELGEMLPMNVMPDKYLKPTQGNGFWLECHKENGQWNVCYRSGRRVEYCFKKANTEADARGLMLCYLLENGLIPSSTADSRSSAPLP